MDVQPESSIRLAQRPEISEGRIMHHMMEAAQLGKDRGQRELALRGGTGSFSDEQLRAFSVDFGAVLTRIESSIAAHNKEFERLSNLLTDIFQNNGDTEKGNAILTERGKLTPNYGNWIKYLNRTIDCAVERARNGASDLIAAIESCGVQRFAGLTGAVSEERIIAVQAFSGTAARTEKHGVFHGNDILKMALSEPIALRALKPETFSAILQDAIRDPERPDVFLSATVARVAARRADLATIVPDTFLQILAEPQNKKGWNWQIDSLQLAIEVVSARVESPLALHEQLIRIIPAETAFSHLKVPPDISDHQRRARCQDSPLPGTIALNMVHGFARYLEIVPEAAAEFSAPQHQKLPGELMNLGLRSTELFGTVRNILTIAGVTDQKKFHSLFNREFSNLFSISTSSPWWRTTASRGSEHPLLAITNLMLSEPSLVEMLRDDGVASSKGTLSADSPRAGWLGLISRMEKLLRSEVCRESRGMDFKFTAESAVKAIDAFTQSDRLVALSAEGLVALHGFLTEVIRDNYPRLTSQTRQYERTRPDGTKEFFLVDGFEPRDASYALHKLKDIFGKMHPVFGEAASQQPAAA